MTRQAASHWAIITDLDGTLLDHQNYSFAPALEAIEKVRREKIPLIFCSSKTAAEIRQLQGRIGITDPFVAENGGAVYLENASTSLSVIEIGTEVGLLEEALFGIGETVGLSLKPITRMPVEEVMELTGLSADGAQLARQRKYSLPFVVEQTKVNWTSLEREASSRRFNLTRGGRFAHLMGDNNKGTAVTKLVTYWESAGHDSVRTVGLGDSQNDLAMLEIVDLPIRIPNPGSSAPLRDELEWAVEVKESGPIGWNEAISAFLDRFFTT